MKSKRPSPETFLKQAFEEEAQKTRARLKIYLGSAPGVGKTYTMLQDALAEREKGLDVVIGVIESHGRKEIEKYLTSFEVIPKKEIEYHGRNLLEFDLETALKRSPALILVDELAHTNAPNSRHAKRWQDIKEILKRGIDVYTTLNVQHIESVSDDASQIIHAPIKEIVPDEMIERADIIELVDLPAENLLQRLKEGKVYIPEQAALAAEHYFLKGNLIALRELALRTTAARVGAQVLLYRKGQGIKHIWPTKERIIVCVGPGPESLKLIRAASRMAKHLEAEWIAVYVEKISSKNSDEKHSQAIQNLRYAERLGAEKVILSGFDIVKELMNFAREQNVTQIMIWKHIGTRWQDFFSRHLADEVLRHSGEIDVYIMTGLRAGVKQSKRRKKSELNIWQDYLLVMIIVSLVTFIDFVLRPYLTNSNLLMVYLLGITVIALLGRVIPSVFGVVLSVIAFKFFFVPPYYSLVSDDIQYLFTLFVLLLVGILISHSTFLIRKQVKFAYLAQRQAEVLHQFTHQLAMIRGVDNILKEGVIYLAKIFNSDVMILLMNNRLEIKANSQPKETLDEKEQSVAQWVFDFNQIAGFGTETLPFAKALYLPLKTTEGTIGVLRVSSHNQEILTLEQMHLLESCIDQIELALQVDQSQSS